MGGYHRLVEHGRRNRRRLALLVNWSGQVLLYPVYAGIQGLRLTVRQLAFQVRRVTTSIAHGQSHFTPLPADEPVRQVLSVLNDSKEIEIWGLQPGNSALNSRTIQGIACDRQNLQLVLVHEDNSTLELSGDQQTRLENLVHRLLAEYAYHQYQRRRNLRLSNLSLPMPAPQRSAWQPVRTFLQILRWLQSGPVATAINLFGEAQLSLNPLQNPQLEPISSPPAPLAGRSEPLLGSIALPESVSQTEPRAFLLEWNGATANRANRSFQNAPSAPLPASATAPVLPTLQPLPALPDSDESWIDIRPTTEHYSKDPLVILLQWIDRGLLWLERTLSKLWRYLRSWL